MQDFGTPAVNPIILVTCSRSGDNSVTIYQLACIWKRTMRESPTAGLNPSAPSKADSTFSKPSSMLSTSALTDETCFKGPEARLQNMHKVHELPGRFM